MAGWVGENVTTSELYFPNLITLNSKVKTFRPSAEIESGCSTWNERVVDICLLLLLNDRLIDFLLTLCTGLPDATLFPSFLNWNSHSSFPFLIAFALLSLQFHGPSHHHLHIMNKAVVLSSLIGIAFILYWLNHVTLTVYPFLTLQVTLFISGIST
jgi:hypothetical protein